MSAIPAPAAPRTRRRPKQAPARPARPRPQGAEQRRRAPRRTAVRGRFASLPNLILVGVVGLLLGGVVFLQVSALRADMAAGSVRTETAKLRAELPGLQADIAQKTSAGRIARIARQEGMVYAPVDAVIGIHVGRKAATLGWTR